MPAYIYPSSGGDTLVDRTGTQTITGPKTFLAGSATTIPLVIQAASGQTVNLTEWKDSGGTNLSRVMSNGSFVSPVIQGGAQFTSTINYATLIGWSQTPETRGIVIRGATSQTANLQEWQDSTGAIVGAISSNGLQSWGPLGVGGTFISPGSGRLNVQTTSAGAPNPVITARGAVGQTGNLQEWQTSTGTVLSKVEPGGTLEAVRLVGRPNSPTLVPLYAVGTVGQTANLQEWQNSAGTVLAKVNSSGVVSSKQGLNFGSAWRTTNEDGPDNNGYHVTWQEGTPESAGTALWWDGGQGLKCRYSGYYQFTAHIHTNSTSQGVHQHVIRRNSDGATLAEYYSGVSGGSRQTTTGPMYVEANDIILVLVRSPDGVAWVHNGQGPYIRGFYLGPA